MTESGWPSTYQKKPEFEKIMHRRMDWKEKVVKAYHLNREPEKLPAWEFTKLKKD